MPVDLLLALAGAALLVVMLVAGLLALLFGAIDSRRLRRRR